MRARRPLLTLLALTTLAPLIGCFPIFYSVPGNGIEATVTRTVEAFTQVAHFGAATINITVGDTQSVTITGDENILPYISTTVTDGKLTIRPTQPILPQDPTTIDITVTDLSLLELGGAGDITVTELDNDALTINVAGAGSFVLSGQTAALTATLDGAGSIDASELVADTATITIAGSGNADVNVATALNVTITGIGSVYYTGNPTITQNISGLGTVQPAQ